METLDATKLPAAVLRALQADRPVQLKREGKIIATLRPSRSPASRTELERARRDFSGFAAPTAMTTGPTSSGRLISAARRHLLRCGAGILRQSSARRRRAVGKVPSRSAPGDRLLDYGDGASTAGLTRALAGGPERRPHQVFAGHDREGYVATSQSCQQPPRNGAYRGTEAHRRGIARLVRTRMPVRMTAQRLARAFGYRGNEVFE